MCQGCVLQIEQFNTFGESAVYDESLRMLENRLT